MTSLMSNVYNYMKETDKMEHMVTGFIGVFDSREKAMNVWNDTLIELGVPSGRVHEYAPGEGIGHRFILLNMNGKMAEKMEDVEFIIELMIKDSELNEVLKNEYAQA